MKEQKYLRKPLYLIYQFQHGMKNLNYLMDLILCLRFTIILSIWSRGMTHCLINHQFKYMLTKFKTELVKAGYYLERLIPETVKLLVSTKRRIKDKNLKTAPQLEIAKVVFVPCNIASNWYRHILISHQQIMMANLSIININMIQEFCVHFFQLLNLINY